LFKWITNIGSIVFADQLIIPLLPKQNPPVKIELAANKYRKYYIFNIYILKIIYKISPLL